MKEILFMCSQMTDNITQEDDFKYIV